MQAECSTHSMGKEACPAHTSPVSSRLVPLACRSGTGIRRGWHPQTFHLQPHDFRLSGVAFGHELASNKVVINGRPPGHSYHLADHTFRTAMKAVMASAPRAAKASANLIPAVALSLQSCRRTSCIAINQHQGVCIAEKCSCFR